MKWYTNGLTKNTFLVLPSTQMGLKLMTNNSNFSDHMSVESTRTWPIAKVKKRSKMKPLDRPQTATLEKPEILNENLIYTLDMSIITKELLQIPNLCQTDKLNKTKKLTPVRQIPSSTTKIIKSVRKAIIPNPQLTTTTTSSKDSNNNNGKKLNIIRKSKIKICPKTIRSADIENNLHVFGRCDARTFEHVREPCQTCGRLDQPERFHSHPSTPRYPLQSMSAATKTKLTTTPVTSKSSKHLLVVDSKIENSNTSSVLNNSPTTPEKRPIKKSPYLTKMNVSSQKLSTSNAGGHQRPSSTPRKPPVKTCYLCGKEFGSASLPFHESKCLERWERENAKLPPSLRRHPPPKPKDGLSTEEWNEMAWKSSQSTLIPCENCNRTFLPDRLEVHQRSCRPEKSKQQNGWTSPKPGPPTVECYICRRKFGTKSIAIHEPQCLKKWHLQNNQLPPNERSKPPIKPAAETSRSSTTTSLQTAATSEILLTPKSTTSEKPKTQSLQKVNVSGEKTETSKRKRTIPCYLCGRQYVPSSLKFHEPECLKKWHNENNKLPPSQRRKEPTKPDIVFTESGSIDYDVTSDENWKTHLSQLIPCGKCARKFFPDRVKIHENSCKG